MNVRKNDESRALAPLLSNWQQFTDKQTLLVAGLDCLAGVAGTDRSIGLYVAQAPNGAMRPALLRCAPRCVLPEDPDVPHNWAAGRRENALILPISGIKGARMGAIVIDEAADLSDEDRQYIKMIAELLSLMLAEMRGRRARQILRRARHQIIAFDPVNLRLSEVNISARDALGLSDDTVPTRSFPELLADYGRAQVEDMLAPLVRGRTSELRVEAMLRRQDGSSYPADILIHILPGPPQSCVAQILDISARREAKNQLRAAVEALPDAFVLFDTDDRMVLCNERYRELYSHSAPAMHPGASFRDILRYGLAHGQYVDAIGREEEWLAERMAAHRAPSKPLEQKLNDGRWLRVLESETPEGGRVGFRVDISALKNQQDELEEARQRAEAANDAKSAFLAMISHEIRTPMNGVIGMTELLADSALDAGQRGWVATILESSQILLSLINDLLDVAKIEAGRLEMEHVALSPGRLASHVVALHGPVAHRKGLCLNVQVAPQAEALRMGDPHRLEQVLNNLLSNALKFTESGSVVLALDSTQGGDLRITVRDTGIGMTNDQVSRVFDDFAQADSSTTRRYGGTGLGMGITRRLVEAMDGRLEITSALGQGTEIGLFLPLPLAPDDAVRATAWAELPPRAPDTGVSRAGPKVLRNRDRTIETERLTGMRVLVTDDNATNRKVLSAYLERVGIAVTLASSGQESLDAFAPGLFDAVLMDISMPDMDGPETLDRLRMKEVEARARVAIPVLAVTAHALPDEVTEFLTRGFAGHVAKPIRADDLMSALITIREAGAAHGDAPVEVPGAG